MSFRFSACILGLVLMVQGWPQPLLAQQDTPPALADQQPGVGVEPAAPAEAPLPEANEPARGLDRSGPSGGAVVMIGGDASLAAGESTDAVVAILGSATSAGTVDESVVSILGNATVSGRVGESVVSILGDVHVNGEVDDQVVAVLGNVELGPDARVDGDVVVIGGVLERDAAAQVAGRVRNVGTGFRLGSFTWLEAWIDNCLAYGRPLALAPGLGWAWTLAVGFLVLYIVLALLFRSTTEKCLATLESTPGRTLLTAFLALLMKPIVVVLLLITVVGIAVIPFLWMALFFAGLFGTMVMLAWVGRLGTRFLGALNHPALAVLVGGLIVMAVYLIPVVGFIVYKLLGFLGLGVVIHTLLLAWQAGHPPLATGVAGAGPAVPGQEMRREYASAAGSTSAPEFEGPSANAAAGAPASSSTTAAADGHSLPRAGFWIRMGALFIDTVLLGIVLAVVDSPGSSILLVLAAYGAIMWKLKSTTIGGSICGLKVVRLDGQPIDWSTAIVRALSCFLSLAIAFLGFLWVIFDRERQSWHDKIAGTTVVRVPKGVSLL